MINSADLGKDTNKSIDLYVFMKAMDKYNILDELISS